MAHCVIHVNSFMRPQSNYFPGEQKAIKLMYTPDKVFSLYKSQQKNHYANSQGIYQINNAIFYPIKPIWPAFVYLLVHK